MVDFQVPSKSTRMERGASIVSDALQQLVGLGLDEGEIDYLIQEQASILETEQLPFKIVLVGPFQEWTEQCAQQIEDAIQHEITPVDTSQVEQHADAD